MPLVNGKYILFFSTRLPKVPEIVKQKLLTQLPNVRYLLQRLLVLDILAKIVSYKGINVKRNVLLYSKITAKSLKSSQSYNKMIPVSSSHYEQVDIKVMQDLTILEGGTGGCQNDCRASYAEFKILGIAEQAIFQIRVVEKHGPDQLHLFHSSFHINFYIMFFIFDLKFFLKAYFILLKYKYCYFSKYGKGSHDISEYNFTPLFQRFFELGLILLIQFFKTWQIPLGIFTATGVTYNSKTQSLAVSVTIE